MRQPNLSLVYYLGGVLNLASIGCGFVSPSTFISYKSKFLSVAAADTFAVPASTFFYRSKRREDLDDDDEAVSGAPKEEGPMTPPLVTKEMFLRSLLADEDAAAPTSTALPAKTPSSSPLVKRETKKGKAPSTKPYRVLDNRDSLPFAIQLATPDPYTHPELKRRRAAKVKKRSSAVEHSPLVASRLYASSSNDKNNRSGVGARSELADGETLLGEFQLDHHTTTGDVLQIGDTEYKVLKHRCLYKYAGGKRFVMVKKVLHVKEVGRVQTEELLARQWAQSPPSADLDARD